MRCLVTGGAGFIGHNLIRALLDEGHTVRVLDNLSTGKRDNLGPFQDRIELIEGDLRSYHIVHEAVRNIDVVFHQGALPSVPRSVKDPITTNQVNVEGTLNLLDAAQDTGVRRVVYASSSSIYGENDRLPKKEDMTPQPISPYAVAKLAGEKYCQVFTRTYGLETVCLRYFNVFGPGQDPQSEYSAVIPLFITAFLEGRQITVHGDGEQSRDFTYVDNVVNANLLAAEAKDAPGEVFNVACGDRISLNQMLDHLRTFTEVDVDVVYGDSRPGDVKHSMADIEGARKILGYEPLVSVAEGLRRSVEYYRTVQQS
ncbi:MAG: SDR family oxidoreductase [Candidatus Latescibacteria bacterium]|jgi:UDP-glucose 4-epimerase|nr:SDR family oxidoreductase [Candidatus Latescibacterota bacterium]